MTAHGQQRQLAHGHVYTDPGIPLPNPCNEAEVGIVGIDLQALAMGPHPVKRTSRALDNQRVLIPLPDLDSPSGVEDDLRDAGNRLSKFAGMDRSRMQ
jgi:hypothetical protein